MRITAELVEKSASFMNALCEWELDLRGNKIPAIENLAITRDHYDAIDLTDNDLRKLDGPSFPRLSRLRHLYVSNNQIARIEGGGWSERLPRLETLSLAGNRISSLDDLAGLEEMRGSNLKHLNLFDNPITRTPHYRLAVILRMPWLRSLDFRKISKTERLQAQAMFPSSGGTSLGDSKKKVTEPESESDHEEERKRIKMSIQEATSMEEIERLERELTLSHKIARSSKKK